MSEPPAADPLADRDDGGEHVGRLVADEARRRDTGGDERGGELLGGALAAAARDLAVALHQLGEAVDVDGLPALLGELLGELDREAVGRREREGLLAADRRLRRQRLELLETTCERLAEALLLEGDGVLDLVGVRRELGIGLAHLLADDPRQAVDALEADPLGVLHGTADDAPADVAAPLVRRA